MNKHIGLKVLVIGGTGFIGSHLVKRLLNENISVRVLLRPNSPNAIRLKGLDVDIFQGDMANPESLYDAARGMNAVINAGRVNSADWEDIDRVNIKGTEYLIEAALANKIQRLLHISDIEVYDLLNVKKGLSINEESPYHKNPKKMGAYTYSAVKREKLLKSASNDQGLCMTIIRPGIVVGPLGPVFFPHLGYRFKDKLLIRIGKGKNILPLTYVENTVDGIYKALVEDKAVGQVYNIVDDSEITVKKYLEEFVKVTGKAMKIVSLPYAVPYFATTAYGLAAYTGFIKKGITSRDQFRWKHASMLFDNSKIKNDLGWTPKLSIEEGLKRTFNWYAETVREYK